MKAKIPQELVTAYVEQRMTVYEIADHLGKAVSTVYNALVTESVDTSRHRHRMKTRNEQIVEAHDELQNMELVGQRFGITRERVRQILKDHERSKQKI